MSRKTKNNDRAANILAELAEKQAQLEEAKRQEAEARRQRRAEDKALKELEAQAFEVACTHLGKAVATLAGVTDTSGVMDLQETICVGPIGEMLSTSSLTEDGPSSTDDGKSDGDSSVTAAEQPDESSTSAVGAMHGVDGEGWAASPAPDEAASYAT